jgi:hypothetical protein
MVVCRVMLRKWVVWWTLAHRRFVSPRFFGPRVLPRARAVPQLTRWQVERSVYRAVDVARLEASVRVAKRDCRSYTRVYSLSDGFCDQVSAAWRLCAVVQLEHKAEAYRYW